MQDQNSSTLRWRSFSGWGRECIAIGFACEGGHYLIYGFVQPIAGWITQMQHRKSFTCCWRSFWGWGTERVAIVCQRWHPILRLWMFSTNRHLGCQSWKAKNHWRSVDAHFQNGAVTALLSPLPIMAANMSVIHISDHITFQLPYLQD